MRKREKDRRWQTRIWILAKIEDGKIIRRGHWRKLRKKRRYKGEQMKKGSFKTTQSGNRRAYFILESQTNEKGEFRALIAVENEEGYYKTDWFWGSDLNQTEKIAREKNLVMGITRRTGSGVES